LSVENCPKHLQDSKFFIIKSFTEEDVHKAIKYKVWSSTPRGMDILTGAYNYIMSQKSKGGYSKG